MFSSRNHDQKDHGTAQWVMLRSNNIATSELQILTISRQKEHHTAYILKDIQCAPQGQASPAAMVPSMLPLGSQLPIPGKEEMN